MQVFIDRTKEKTNNNYLLKTRTIMKDTIKKQIEANKNIKRYNEFDYKKRCGKDYQISWTGYYYQGDTERYYFSIGIKEHLNLRDDKTYYFDDGLDGDTLIKNFNGLKAEQINIQSLINSIKEEMYCIEGIEK